MAGAPADYILFHWRASPKRVHEVREDDMDDAKLRRARASRGTLGSLESLGFPEIMQSLALGRKTARVTLTSQGRWGHIWLEDGMVKHAQTRELAGELAFYRMVGWSDGEFLIEPDIRTETRSLDHDPMYLVMEGSRRVDESSGDVSACATPAAREALATIPLSAPAARPPRHGREPARASGAQRVAPAPRRRAMRRRWLLAASIVPLLAIGIWLPSRGRVAPPPDRGPTSPRVALAPPAVDSPRVESSPESATAADSGSTAMAVLVDSAPAPAPRVAPPVEAPGAPPEAAPREVRSYALDLSPGSIAPAIVLLGHDAGPEAMEGAASFLKILGKSSVRSGRLTLRVDGAEVYVRELIAETGKAKRFFKRMFGKAGESFETTVEIEPGRHEIVAHVAMVDDGSGYDSRIEIEIAAGATRELHLVAGRKLGPPMSLTVEAPQASDRGAEDATAPDLGSSDHGAVSQSPDARSAERVPGTP
jgi:hypothetical protein